MTIRRTHESQPSSPVERILICYPTLSEKCLEGKSLSEDADLDELTEEIFLYTNTKEDSSKQNHNSDEWKKEAVQFMGLCVALYSLPSSLKDGERTKQVYLGKSTLIFVPLEQNGDILAVLQIRRGGGNPLAVRQSIEKCHSLFGMFHQGGILDRLKQRQRGNEMANNDSNCVYPGLDQLYSIRKDIRKHRIKQSRLSGIDGEYAKLQEQMDKLGLQLDQLQQQLPNESIRRDLESHYNEYLDNLSLVTSRQGGGLRCLVDCVPAPMAQESGLHTVQSAPHRLSPEVISKLKTDVQHILSQDNHQPLLYGISTFYMGHLVQLDFFGNGFTELLPSETVSTIMGYMSSYLIKLQQQNVHEHHVNSPLRFRKIASSLAYTNYQDHPNRTPSGAASTEHGAGGSFLEPPPSYMMSGTEENQSVEIQNEQVAWAPTITLPKTRDEERNRNARVVLYVVGNYCFLVFLHHEKQFALQSNGERNMISNVLTSVRNQLDSAVLTSRTMSQAALSKDSPNKPTSSLREPGVDYIMIDRRQQELVLFTDHKSVVHSPMKKPPALNGASPRKGLFGFLPPKMDLAPPTQNQPKTISPRSLEWSVLGLDCRHLLASHLHLDVLLAFDDMMNDISTKFSGSDSNDYVELCTCMTLGWVYGCANESTELYAFFDNSTYVTVSDVQNAVKRIKEKVSQN